MEWYFQEAWDKFLIVVDWMKSTTILTVGGVNVTFLGLLITISIFDILLWVIYQLLDVAIDID